MSGGEVPQPLDLPLDVSRVLLVSNLPKKLKPSQLHALFARFGGLVEVRVGSTEETEGQAIIAYDDIFDAETAQSRLNGLAFGKSALAVAFHPSGL